jgi:hypothetical protein
MALKRTESRPKYFANTAQIWLQFAKYFGLDSVCFRAVLKQMLTNSVLLNSESLLTIDAGGMVAGLLRGNFCEKKEAKEMRPNKFIC